MTIGIENTGTIDSIMKTNAFKVHDMMFNVKECIQFVFLCSKSMYTMFHQDNCNIFVITINPTNSSVSSMPMSLNDTYNECVIRNNTDSTPQSEVHNKKNMYILKDGNIILFVTKGYIMDNFLIKDSYHDFKLVEGNPTIRITAQDIESLTMKNPEVR